MPATGGRPMATGRRRASGVPVRSSPHVVATVVPAAAPAGALAGRCCRRRRGATRAAARGRQPRWSAPACRRDALVGGGAGGRQRRTPRLAWRADAAGQPGLADQAAHHLRRARPARPGLDLDARRCGCTGTRAPTACSRATSSSRAAATRSWCSSACGCCCAACSSWACARSAATSCSTAAPSSVPERDPADFDGEPLRPVQRARRRAAAEPTSSVLLHLHARRRRAAWRWSASTRRWPACRSTPACRWPPAPATTGAARCKADFSDPTRMRFAGSYPPACGEKALAAGLPDPRSYNDAPGRGAVARAWAARSAGSVRDGPAPGGAHRASSSASPPLAEVVRDINKFSNNVMAQQLFLTLGLQRAAAGHARGRARGAAPLAGRAPRAQRADGVVIDNGSGLSRETRLSAQQLLARLLQAAWASPVMPELMASLPVSGHRRHAAPLAGAAGPRPPEDRLAARRGRRGRLRAGAQRPALRAGGDRQPPERQRRAAGARRAGAVGHRRRRQLRRRRRTIQN